MKHSLSKLFFQLGLILLLSTCAIVVKNYETIHWLSVDPSRYANSSGTVTDSRMYHSGLRGGWRFYIAYDYFVDGNKYTSDRVHYGYQVLSDKSYAQGYVDKYPIGKSVKVYFPRNDPSKSVLEPGVKWYGLLYYIIAFFVLSLVLLFLSWRYKRNELTPPTPNDTPQAIQNT